VAVAVWICCAWAGTTGICKTRLRQTTVKRLRMQSGRFGSRENRTGSPHLSTVRASTTFNFVFVFVQCVQVLQVHLYVLFFNFTLFFQTCLIRLECRVTMLWNTPPKPTFYSTIFPPHPTGMTLSLSPTGSHATTNFNPCRALPLTPPNTTHHTYTDPLGYPQRGPPSNAWPSINLHFLHIKSLGPLHMHHGLSTTMTTILLD
jgi:hypothetical protein